jgi:RNA polymerase sigma-70 factor (ECF subfamily)
MKEPDPDTISDQTLMMSVREGNLEKLGMIFERHHVPLFNYFLHLTGNRHLSEDLVQEVFVRLLKYRYTYREKSMFTGWMFQIARNVRIDYLRKSPHEEVSIEDSTREHVSRMPTPGEQTEESERKQIIQMALSRLPEEKREVLLLRGVHGLKFEEIAETLKCSVNTIKSRVFRAIQDLRIAVHKLEGENEQ